MSEETLPPQPTGAAPACAEAPIRISTGRLALRQMLRRKLFVFGAVVVVLVVITAIFAPLLAPHNPYLQDLKNTKAGPSLQHLLGTDTLGRDTLSRIIYGARTSLIVGLVAVGMSGLIGMTLGTLAGYLGGWIRSVIMRLVDALMTLPMILLALTLAALLGGGLKNVVIALGFSMIPPYARLMCAQTMSIMEKDYVSSLRSMGSHGARIMFNHVLPNSFPPVLAFGTMQIGFAILAEAGLSFLGIGINPPGAAWGAMVNEGSRYLLTNPLLSIAPGVAIMLTVFAFNMAGDGLRDVLDPRLRGMG